MLQFGKAVVEKLENGRTFCLMEKNPEPATPITYFHFNQNHLHYPISNNSRLTCKVHIQRVDTQYSCAICGVRMCHAGFSIEGSTWPLTANYFEIFSGLLCV